ncbi:MAG TPA: SMI1/KNR4 family protein [Polyangia bacterium]|nr:SMI1/KNR4 family protein [Polyangia bacterium]
MGDPVLERVAAKLDRLGALDRGRAVFGATNHQYFSRPVAPAAVERLESYLGVGLPGPYRAFLLEVGAGAGPYHGLWSPEQTLHELVSLVDGIVDEGEPAPRFDRPFPVDRAWGAAVGREMATTGAAAADHPYPCDGAIPIADQGCAYWSALITVGDYAGTVWSVANAVGTEGIWAPGERPPGLLDRRVKLPPIPCPPTFLDWCEGWLDGCLHELGGA